MKKFEKSVYLDYINKIGKKLIETKEECSVKVLYTEFNKLVEEQTKKYKESKKK